MNLKRATSIRLGAGVLFAALGISVAIAQQPAAPAAKAPAPVAASTTTTTTPTTTAPATTAPANAAPADATPKAAPKLAPGSTAGVGWNNPPKWSDVEQKPQYASVPGREMNVLVEDKGQWWRSVRNGPVTFYGGIALLIVPVLLLIFFGVKGSFKLHGTPTGRLIERFNSLERMAHWTMAISFVVLALTGIIILFGKYFLLPIMGPSLFAGLTTLGKNLHNFVGPLFIFSIIVFFFIFVKDNFLAGRDFEWLSKFGGLFADKEVPSGRFNGGEKVWFWLSVVLLGAIVSVSGLIQLFPNWNTTREIMAEANLVHAVIGLSFIAVSLGHIYIGTIGSEGAYKGMREGYVDETWAREHHALWYEEVKTGKRSEKIIGSVQPAAGD